MANVRGDLLGNDELLLGVIGLKSLTYTVAHFKRFGGSKIDSSVYFHQLRFNLGGFPLHRKSPFPIGKSPSDNFLRKIYPTYKIQQAMESMTNTKNEDKKGFLEYSFSIPKCRHNIWCRISCSIYF